MDAVVAVGTILFGLAALWVASLMLFWVLRPRGVPLGELVRIVPDLVRMLRALATDPSTPMDVRVALVGLLVWLVSPIDLIPEFIPVIGPIDDLVVAVIALRYARRRLGIDGLQAHWPGTDDGFALLGRVVGSDARP